MKIPYAASGASYLAEAMLSANSARRHMPKVTIEFWIDDPSLLDAADHSFDVTHQMRHVSHSFMDKIDPILMS